ncbi:MAG: cytochrome P450 [Pseudomonadota bacterium]
MSTPSQSIPTGIALSPLNEKFRATPYQILDEVRTLEPVHRDEEFKRIFLTSHDDVHQCLHDKSMWSDPRKAKPGTFASAQVNPENPEEEPSMLLADDPLHRRLRGLINKAFTIKAVEAMRPQVRTLADSLLAEIDTEEFDLIQSFAAPLPTIVIAKMLGIDTEDYSKFKRWSDLSISASFRAPYSEEEIQISRQASKDLDNFFYQEVEAKRTQPTDGLISAMIQVDEGGERFTDQEIVRLLNLLLVAGNVTTTDLIGNGVRALLEHPEQLVKLRANPDLLKNAIEEMLRYDSPVMLTGRIAPRDMEISGCPVHQGESLTTSLAGANHDPTIYENPHKFDIERQDIHHHSFGGGRHFCLGAPLARVEAQEAISALLRRYRLLEPSERGHVYHALIAFRGMTNYWVKGEG